MTSLPKDIASLTGHGRPNLAPIVLSSNRPLAKILKYYNNTLKSLPLVIASCNNTFNQSIPMLNIRTMPDSYANCLLISNSNE